MVLLSLTAEASDRPWWENKIEIEHQILMLQNKAIMTQIQKVQTHFSKSYLREFEAEARIYTKAFETALTTSNEKAIREEIKRITSSAKPYFESNRRLIKSMFAAEAP